nr:uncharacterized protein LOC128702834 [Cherax quadricarinatus]
MRMMTERNLLLRVLVSGCVLISLLSLSSAQGRKVGSPSTPSQGQRMDPRHSVLPLVRFQCVGRPSGYYGDMDFGCTVFHYCTDSAQRFTYQCIDGLKFNEVTTSCSAGFFGDCTHTGTVGPTGSNKSDDSAPVKSFQNLPALLRTDEDDSRRRYDPELDVDYNYEYFDTDNVQPVLQAPHPVASKRMIKNTNVKLPSSGVWDNSMTSALSAFASLANIPYDNPTTTKDEIVDRTDNVDGVDYVDTIDRAFIDLPPQRRRLPQRQSSSHFFQLPFFQGKPKKSPRVPQRTASKEQSFARPWASYPPPPTGPHNPHTDSTYEESSDYRRQPQRYDFDDSVNDDEDNPYNSSEVSQTTPDTFRPSSRITNDPDEFQPVTPASGPAASREPTELVRPNRDAIHQTGHGALSSSFQSFSPSSTPFRSQASFPAQSSIGVPKTSRTVQSNPPNFLSTPSFPSSGNFVFNQPPIHPAVFNRQFHQTSGFGAPPAPRQQVDNFGRPSSSQQTDSFGRPSSSHHQVDSFGRPPSQRQADSFDHPPSQHQVDSFGRLASPQQVDNSGRPLSSQQQVDNFGRPKSPQHQVDTFGRPPHQQQVDSLGRPPLPQHQVDIFGRPSSTHQQADTFGRLSPPTQPDPRPVQSFNHQHVQGFAHSPTPQSVSSFRKPSASPPGHSFSQAAAPPQPETVFRRPTFPPNFAQQSPSFGFVHPPPQQRPPQSFVRPTPSPPFTVQTPATLGIQGLFTPSFQQDRPTHHGNTVPQPVQHSFQDSTESPSSTVSTFPQAKGTSVTEESQQSPRLSHRDRVFNFFRATVAPSASEASDVLNAFDADNDVFNKPEDPQKDEEPEDQNTDRPAVEQRPSARRRPNSNKQEQQQQQSVRRRPSRPRRPIQQPTTPSTLITGLENSEFHNPFLQSNERLPSFTRLQPQPVTEETSEKPFVFPTSPASQIRGEFPRLPGINIDQESSIFQPQPGIFHPNLGPAGISEENHFDNNVHPQGNINDDTLPDIINAVESMEEETNIILPIKNDYENAGEEPRDVTESAVTTTTPEPPTEVSRPLTRRRPNIRNRLRTRLTSRTTTLAPVQTEPEKPDEYEPDLPEEYPEITDSSVRATTTEPTTTLPPFRKRIQTRLNRLKNSRQNNAPVTPQSITTEQPESEEDALTTTTANRKRPSSRRGGLDPERFKRYRNRLRGITATSDNPEPDLESTTTENPLNAASFTPNTRNRRINRFRPKSSQREGDNVLEVKEILRTDQEVQETSRSLVHKEPSFGQLSSQLHTSSAETRNIQESRGSSATPNQSSLPTPEQPKKVESERGEAGGDTSPRSLQQPEHDTDVAPGDETGRKIINPDFRARFREFLKNRKHQLSARYRKTETPDIVEAEDSSDKELPEAFNPIFPERNPQQGQNLREARAKFLSNGQLSDEERSSRRIPFRPFRNNFSGKIKPAQEESEEPVEKTREGEEGEKHDTLLKEGEEHKKDDALIREGEEHKDDSLIREGEEHKDDSLIREGEEHKDDTLLREGEGGEEHVLEETITREISSKPQEAEIESQEKKEISASPPDEGPGLESSGGFRPLHSPFTSNGEPSPAPVYHHQEPEIITASPVSEEGGIVMSITVSANLGGHPEEPVTEAHEHPINPEPKINTPSEIIVKEIVTGSSSDKESKSGEARDLQTAASEESPSPLHSASSQTSAEENSESSPAADESQEPPVLITVQPRQLEASNIAVPLQELPSPAPSVSEDSPEGKDSDDIPEIHVPRASKPIFNLSGTLGRAKEAETSAPDSDSEQPADTLTPTSFSITMATDQPKLPLEMLLPLFGTR